MNFDIIYNGISIESFTTTTVRRAKTYVRQRYMNNGAGCSISYVKNGNRVTETV